MTHLINVRTDRGSLQNQYELNAISCQNGGEHKHAENALNKQALSFVEVFHICILDYIEEAQSVRWCLPFLKAARYCASSN